jgi:hypothetical protein
MRFHRGLIQARSGCALNAKGCWRVWGVAIGAIGLGTGAHLARYGGEMRLGGERRDGLPPSEEGRQSQEKTEGYASPRVCTLARAAQRRQRGASRAPLNDDAPVKIGCSSAPLRRLATLQTGQPAPVYFIRLLEGADAEEAEIHRALSDLHMHGETFRFSADMLTTDYGLADFLLPRFPAFVPSPWLEDPPSLRSWRKLVRRMIEYGPLPDRGVAGALRWGEYEAPLCRRCGSLPGRQAVSAGNQFKL